MGTLRRIKRGKLQVVMNSITNQPEVVKVLRKNNRKLTRGKMSNKTFDYTLRYSGGNVILLKSGLPIHETSLFILDKFVEDDKNIDKKCFIDLTTNQKVKLMLSI